MRLTWKVEYSDYSDEEHWLPRLKKLQEFANHLSVESVSVKDTETLLNDLELIEELMRYYASVKDFANLEPIMRIYQQMLEVCKSRDAACTEVLYLEMEFVRLNALLYLSHNQNRKAVEVFEQYLVHAEQCFQSVQNESRFSREQLLYIGWSCIEGCKEAANANDALLDLKRSFEILNMMLPKLEWLEQYILDEAGIALRVAEIYSAAGGLSYQSNAVLQGEKCFLKSIQIYKELYEKYESDFYKANEIWKQSLYGIQALIMQGNVQPMIACENKATAYLRKKELCNRDRGILLGAQGMVMIQRSLLNQQNGNLTEAVQLADSGCNKLKEALVLLGKELDDERTYYYGLIKTMANQVFSVYVSGLDLIGVQYYFTERFADARDSFMELLKVLTDCDDYSIAETTAMFTRAEGLQYLSLIFSNENNISQAEFYGIQAAELATEAARKTGNPTAWEMAVSSSTVISEISLGLKKKEQAKKYADMGLDACQSLEQINPKSERLEMKSLLEKFKKKASRRFF